MTRRASRMRRRSGSDEGLPKRHPDYHNLRNPFPPVPVYSGDRVCAMHEAALDLLENLGMKILLPEARDLFRCAGALVDDDTEIVRIGREIVAQAIATALRCDPCSVDPLPQGPVCKFEGVTPDP